MFLWLPSLQRKVSCRICYSLVCIAVFSVVYMPWKFINLFLKSELFYVRVKLWQRILRTLAIASLLFWQIIWNCFQLFMFPAVYWKSWRYLDHFSHLAYFLVFSCQYSLCCQWWDFTSYMKLRLCTRTSGIANGVGFFFS